MSPTRRAEPLTRARAGGVRDDGVRRVGTRRRTGWTGIRRMVAAAPATGTSGWAYNPPRGPRARPRTGEVAEWSNAPDSKSGIRFRRIEGSNPSLSAHRARASRARRQRPARAGSRRLPAPSVRCDRGRRRHGGKLAEREGFEPSIRDKTYTPLAGERLQPLGHLSDIPTRRYRHLVARYATSSMARKRRLEADTAREVDASIEITNRYVESGAPGRIRTSDRLVRSQVLYPTELRARCASRRDRVWCLHPVASTVERVFERRRRTAGADRTGGPGISPRWPPAHRARRPSRGRR